MKLLFDVHVARATVAALRKIAPQIQAEHLAHWHGGMLLQAEDDEILLKCHAEGRVFVTCDMATIPDLLRRWIAEERSHSGLFFADESTIKPNHPGEVAPAVAAIAEEIGNADTTNLI
ncbi:MAG TPA: DUF5615 family PIN-like protein [Verrucomicrobiae bacterium]|nr:DUF5615 family PIN-like protein [Verrucomicrobiae bacterium]